jgi:hypothetical protein
MPESASILAGSRSERREMPALARKRMTIPTNKTTGQKSLARYRFERGFWFSIALRKRYFQV